MSRALRPRHSMLLFSLSSLLSLFSGRLVILQLLAHELSLGKRHPPLVLGAVRVVDQVHQSQGDLLPGLSEVRLEGLRLFPARRVRVVRVEREESIARNRELGRTDLLELSLGYGSERNEQHEDKWGVGCIEKGSKTFGFGRYSLELLDALKKNKRKKMRGSRKRGLFWQGNREQEG